MKTPSLVGYFCLDLLLSKPCGLEL
uniref:Uncharacterized protein n=1 Tax=Anguilla anguilla TaxID=7936 RepID=A0A0E9RAE8_ANGAN